MRKINNVNSLRNKNIKKKKKKWKNSFISCP